MMITNLMVDIQDGSIGAANSSLQISDLNDIDKLNDVMATTEMFTVNQNFMNIVDDLHNSSQVISTAQNSMGDFNSVQSKLELQKSITDFAVNTAILSKTVSTAIKSIDSLVRIQ